LKKIFALAPAAENPWYSCRVIEEAALEAMGPDGHFEVVMVRDGLTHELIQQLEVEACAVMVLSTPLLQQVAEQIAKLKSVKLLIPIFGDMTIETVLWSRLSTQLRGKNIVLLGASTRQCQQLQRFVKGASIRKLPYTLPTFWSVPTVHAPSEKLRLVYAGRLTPQKNVLELMSCFLRAAGEREDLELHVAGTFHELGHHFHGLGYDFAEYRQRFNELLEHGKGKIFFHEFLAQPELRELFDRCDTFVSLSTYHDEDFGVSAAQAMSLGLNALLSDWGGHWDFKNQGLAELIPVEVQTNNVPLPRLNIFVKLLLGLARPGHLERVSRQEKMWQYLGHTSYRERLVMIAEESIVDYEGQSTLFEEYASGSEARYVFNEGIGAKSRQQYLAIYGSYLTTDAGESYEF